MLGILFIVLLSIFCTPFLIFIGIFLMKKVFTFDDTLNGLKFYQRDVVGVYTDKNGNKIMINRNE